MKGVSNIIALLMIIGITIAVAVIVSNIVLTQVNRAGQQPKHLLLTSKEVLRIGSTGLKMKITFYNPSNLVFTICPSSATIYRSVLGDEVYLTFADRSCISISPGESGKLEVLATSQQYIDKGIIGIDLSISSPAGSYSDLVFIPLK